jgi:drug/metabolite transporter (DMT)-like permease
MGYGALAAALAATLSGAHWSFDPRPAYLASLVYLAVFGSVIAFAAYFRVLERAGPGPASFVGVSTPVIAMLLTTLVEGYQWSGAAVLGLGLAIAGNAVALRAAR